MIMPESTKVLKAEKLEIGNHLYPMISKIRGICLIINNERFDTNRLSFREGSSYEADCFEEVFKQLSFKVIRLDDYSVLRIKERVQTIKKNLKANENDALVVVILSHGEDECFFGSCGEKFYTSNFVKLFNNKNCTPLIGKPKIFFINAYRGGKKYYILYTVQFKWLKPPQFFRIKPERLKL